MKKYTLMGFGLLAFLPIFAFASFDQNLKYGSKGVVVSELQDFLITQSCLTVNTTGNFFSLTLQAVKCFQGKNNLPVTGYFGPMTRTVANSLLTQEIAPANTQEVTETGTTTTPLNTKNDIVTALQNQINALLAQLQELNAKVQTQTTVQQQTQTTLEQTQTTLQQTQQSVQQIQQNTTPVVVPPPVPQPVVIPVDKSDILVETRPYPNRAYVFVVSVLDKTGNYLKEFLVKMEAPDDLNSSRPNYKELTEKGVTSIADGKYYTGFGYHASTTGEKIIKFTAGDLTESILVDVQ